MIDGTEQHFGVNPSIVATDLEDELVLLDPASQQIFSLNATGRAIWQSLPASMASLTHTLEQRFEVEAMQADADVKGLLRSLVDAGLVREL